ncbi:MAG: S41 family peptidase [Calditrichia bacterium]
MRIFPLLVLLCLTLGITIGSAADRLFRFPAISQDKIAFSYAGDLYIVADSGGIARKLTSHVGYEMFPRFSPDGRQIAFTGQYDGNTEVYLISVEGGEPQRLTYTATLSRDDVSDRMGPNNIVMTWKHQSPEIIFRSRMRSFNPFIGELYAVNTNGGMPNQLPLPRGGFCSFSPDDRQLAYNRVFREFRTWKKYRGGMADDIWIYDFKTRETRNITNNPAQDIIPMWHGEDIYFISDRDENRRMNLFVYSHKTGETRQLTRFKEFDIKFPSLGPNAIVFENGGYIYKFDLESETYRKIPIRVNDDGIYARPVLKKVDKEISNYEISPDGKRALFGAHGDVFTVPVKEGPTRNLTQSPGVHERNSKWSPDGRWIAYISDESGEDEIYLRPQQGGKARQITSGSKCYKYQIYWSPDSKKLLWADRLQRLRVVNILTKEITEIDRAERWEIRDYAWAPDSKWVTYARPEVKGMTRIYLANIETGEKISVTEGWYDSYAPAFSSDGKYLFFVSDREFNPIYSETEWNHAYRDMAKIFLVPLAKTTPSPFEPKSDEVEIQMNEKEKSENEELAAPLVNVDKEGISDRIVALPVQAAHYRNLTSVKDVLYYIRNGSKDEKPRLLSYNLKEKKESDLGQVNGFEISADQKKMLISQDRKYAIIDLPISQIKPTDWLDLSGMEMWVDRRAEWKQIFNEAWRQMRDFFYAPNMHGYDWEAIRQQYEPLVEHVNHRADLNYVIGEMIGELNVGHAYVGGGDIPRAELIKMGLLGAQLSRDSQTGFYRIDKILKGQNWDNGLRSPLREVGVDVAEGEYIVAINDTPTNQLRNIYASLVNTAGKQVKLNVNSTPSLKGSRAVTVVPIEDEAPLYYYNWVQKNIARVSERTNGKVGYIHVPDMGPRGLNEFVKHFYPQLQKKALIIDVRGNGGGNVSPMLIERLRRQITMFEIARNGVPTTEPYDMIWGPKVCLVNEYSASDGDLFPYQFKTLKMGELIGKRSWGGVVGIRGSLPFLDGGYLNKPEFSRFGLDGKTWIIEGHGVEPTIYQDNDPAKEFDGIDEQLEKAIDVILEKLKKEEKEIPPIPPYPVK